MRYYIELSDKNEILLRSLEKETVSYKSRVKVHLQERNNDLYVLKTGWLYRYVDLPDDRRQVLRESPRLTALIFSLCMLEEAILLDRITMIGRNSALRRVANYILEIHSRLRTHTDDATFSSFEMLLTQEVIADALGLTNVSVSNAFTQLELDGKIVRNRKVITLTDPEKLKKELNFKDRYFRIDPSWFPKI